MVERWYSFRVSDFKPSAPEILTIVLTAVKYQKAAKATSTVVFECINVETKKSTKFIIVNSDSGRAAKRIAENNRLFQ